MAAAVLIVGGTVLVLNKGWLKSNCRVETNYFCIKVYEDERGGEPVRMERKA